MDVEILVLHVGGFGMGDRPLAIVHVVDFDFVLVGSFGDGVD